MKKINKKDQIKLLIFNSLFFSNSDKLLLKNLFDFIDSMNQVELIKTKIFLERNQHIRSFEENKVYFKLFTIEKENNIRLSTLFTIFIIFKIAEKERNREIQFIINQYLEQKNYRQFTHLLDYTFSNDFLVKSILNSIDRSYNKKSIFLKLKLKIQLMFNYLMRIE